jgi:hypothetical protein
MKKLIILAITFFIFGIPIYAQQGGNYRYAEPHYYSSVLWGANGFRTVEEENKLMAETLAAMKRERDKEENTPEEMAKEKKKHDDEVAAKKTLFDATKKDVVKTKK